MNKAIRSITKINKSNKSVNLCKKKTIDKIRIQLRIC